MSALITLKFALVGTASLMAISCGGGGESPADAVQTALVVDATAAEQVQVPVTITAVGSTSPRARAAPGTRLAGRVRVVDFAEGDRVNAGQVLVRIDDRDLLARRAQAGSGLREAQAVLDNAATQLRRIRNLHRDRAVAQQQLDEAETAHSRAVAAAETADEEMKALAVELEYAAVRAPLTGVVVSKHVQPGDMASPGVPLFVVERQDSLEVVVRVSESDIDHVETGDPVTVDVPAVRPGPQVKEIGGTVATVVPAADPGSRTFRVKVVIANPGGLLGTGMFARVSFVTDRRPALVVPRSAVVQEGQLRGVYVVADHAARLRWLRLGRVWGDGVEVLSGLEAGTEVIVDAPPALRDGSAVTVRAGRDNDA